MSKLPALKPLSLSYSPWVCFFIFLAANTLLSYFPLSFEAKLYVIFLGVLLPFAWALRSPSTAPAALEKEFLSVPPAWLWALLAALALSLRFLGLTTLSVWPHYDEGMIDYYALGLSDNADGPLFFGSSHAPALYVWILGGVFKLFGASLTTLWLVPAVVSTLAVPLAYLAARQFFSRSLSWVALLWALSGFWPLLLGRFSLMTGMVLLGEYLVLFLLGKFLWTSTWVGKRVWAVALGLVLGLGFLIHLHWPVIAAAVLIPLFTGGWRNRAFFGKEAIFWILPFLLLFFPFIYVFWTRGYGPYLLQLTTPVAGNSGGDRLSVILSYPYALFWGMDLRFHTYQPVWGGLLNPALGALSFLGLLESWKRRKEGLHLWLLASLAFFLLAAMATQDREPFRMMPVIPVLFAMASLGTAALAGRFPKKKAGTVVLGLFLLSASLDATHLFGAYHRLWDVRENWRGWAKSLERYRAYKILEPLRRDKGPGMVFGDFVGGLSDQTLTVATYGFNAALNPLLSLHQVHWAALLANVNYLPFLKSRFPDGVAYALSKDSPAADGGLMLFVFSLDENRLEVMEEWCKAQKALEPFIGRNMGFSGGTSLEKELEALGQAEPSFQGDPFLRAAFLEKKSDLEAKQALMRSSMRGGSLPPGGGAAVQSLRKAVTEGYPAAHLYERMGVLELMDRNPVEARKAFEKAVHAPLDLTDASHYLQSPAAPLK